MFHFYSFIDVKISYEWSVDQTRLAGPTHTEGDSEGGQKRKGIVEIFLSHNRFGSNQMRGHAVHGPLLRRSNQTFYY